MNKCTFCGRDFEDFKIVIELQFKAYRKTLADTWEVIDNSNIKTSEILCKTCFDKFVDVIDSTMSHRQNV